MIGKLRIAEITTMIKRNWRINNFIRYHLTITKIPTKTQRAKKIYSPISPKGRLAQSLKNPKTGELPANDNEKKNKHPNMVKLTPSLNLLSTIFFFFFLLAKTRCFII